MTETQSTQPSAKREVPSASDFTSSPLRNRIRVELDAPVSEVWELLGDLSRFPEYSEGLERSVSASRGRGGRCASSSTNAAAWSTPRALAAAAARLQAARRPASSTAHAPTARPAPSPGTARLDRAGREAARHGRGDRRPLSPRPLCRSGPAVGRPAGEVPRAAERRLTSTARPGALRDRRARAARLAPRRGQVLTASRRRVGRARRALPPPPGGNCARAR
jgi:hypothetical protein